MRKILVFILGLLLACTAFACQTTPEKDIIVNRGDNNTNPAKVEIKSPDGEDTAETDNLTYTLPSVPFTPYDAPAHISREGEDKNDIQVVFDSDTHIPETTGYAVMLLEKLPFTDDEIVSWAKHFAGSADLREESEKSQIDYAEEIRGTLEYIAMLEEDYERLRTISYYPQEQLDRYLGWIQEEQERLADLQEAYKAAQTAEDGMPFQIDSHKEDASFSFTASDERSAFGVTRATRYFSYACDSEEASYAEGQYPKNTADAEDTDKKWYAYTQEAYTYSPEQAEADATALLNKLGFADDYDLLSIQKCVFFKGETATGKGYTMVFTRALQGLQAYYSPYDIISTSELARPVVGAAWGEFVIVSLDEDGVHSFRINGRGQQRQLLTDNTELLPIEELLERMENSLRMLYMPQDGSFTLVVKVCDLSLHVANISVKDDLEHGMLTPVWRVSLELIHNFGGNATYTEETDIYFDARDGSYIEPRIATTNLASYFD